MDPAAAWLVSIILGFGLGYLILGLVLYFLPTMIAVCRGHPATLVIFALNAVLGWTLFGWVGALIWSLIMPDRPIHVHLPVRMAPRVEGPSITAYPGFSTARREPVFVAAAPDDTVPCPMCAEAIKRAALKCRFCGHMMAQALAPGV